MKLPILLSVPHAGLRVPPQVQAVCRLSPEEIAADGDEGAAEIYALADEVERFVTTDVARAIVDLNRAPDDRRADGVVKTHTCWNVPVYDPTPSEETFAELLARYYHPYHAELTAAASGGYLLAVDCHTMAAFGPPIAPDPGVQRPHVCLGDVHGQTLPAGWMDRLVACFAEAFGCEIAVNQPFAGGYITRTHGTEMPWVQLELSRGPFATNAEKRERVLDALSRFGAEVR